MSNILTMGTILILAVTVLRALFGNRMSMRLRYAMWLPVVLRLLLPFQIGQSPLSAENVLSPTAEYMPAVVITYEVPDVPASVTVAEESTSPLQILWYTGMAICALWFLYSNVRFYYLARKGAKRIANRGLRIYVSERIDSPCQIGWSIFITPEVAQDEVRMHHVLAHEKTHFYHGDTFWSLLRAVLMCVYWFFPPVWIAAILSKRDCELACDEGALHRLGTEERFAYGKTLLSVAAQASTARQLFCTATTMAQSKQELTARIKAIATRRKRPIWLSMLLLVLMGVATVCTFTGRTKAASQPPKPPTQSHFQDSWVEMTTAQPSEELPVATKPLVKPRPKPLPTEKQTESLPTEPTTYSEPQTEVPYEAQPALPHETLPNALSSGNMAVPSENYEAPSGYNMLEGFIDTSPNYEPATGGMQPCVPGVQMPSNYGFPVISLDPNIEPTVQYPSVEPPPFFP